MDEYSFVSREFRKFVKEEIEKKTLMERVFNNFGKLNFPLPSFAEKKLKKDVTFSRLKVSPEQVFSASITIPLLIALGGIVAFFLTSIPTMIFLFVILFPVISFLYLFTFPGYYADVMKIKMADEAIQIILFMSIYLRITPNFERAVSFAVSYSDGPLTFDLIQILWGIETGKFKSIHKGIEEYANFWVKWSPEFVKSLNILGQIFYESSTKKREEMITKSLNTILRTTKRNMESYIERIYPKISVIYTMGILLPVVGIIMFPIISIFLQNSVDPLYLALGYTVLLPLSLYYVIMKILTRRPGAFKTPDIKHHPDLPPKGKYELKRNGRRILIPVLPLALVIGLLILLPGLLHFGELNYRLNAFPTKTKEIMFAESEMFMPNCISCFSPSYANSNYEVCNPCRHGFNNLISTLSITIGVGIFLILYFYLSSKQRIKIRKEIKDIEKEFRTGLYILGNFLEEDRPVETSVFKCIEESRKYGDKSAIYRFFCKLYENINYLGMTFDQAITHKKYGIIRYFPSPLIIEVTNMIMEFVKKGTKNASKGIKIISKYLDNVDRVEEEFNSLLRKVRASLILLVKFIVPLICGITASLGVFILYILKVLGEKIEAIIDSLNIGLFSGSVSESTNIVSILIGDISNLIPMTALQTLIGIFCLEVVIIIAYLLTTIENGFDKTSTQYNIGTNLITALIIYIVVFMVSNFLFGSIIVSSISLIL